MTTWETILLYATAALSAASIILHVVAPRTKATWDDRLRDDLDQVLGFIRGQQAAKAAAPPTSTASGIIGPIALLALLAGSLLALQPACSASTKQRVANGFGAALNCEAPGLAGTFASMIPLAGAAVASFLTADGKHIDKAQLRAAAAPLTDKDTQLRCALATALAIATTPAKASPDAPAAAGLEVDTAVVRGEARAVLGELGWGEVRTRAGVL
jgi:hypothetical protein